MSKKISELVAGSPVVTSLESDEYETTQGGVSKGALGRQITKVPTIHVNTHEVDVHAFDPEQTLLDAAASRALAAGDVIEIIGFGSFTDPDVVGPTVTIRFIIAGTAVLTTTFTTTDANWYFHGMLTVRAAGVSGHVAAARLE